MKDLDLATAERLVLKALNLTPETAANHYAVYSRAVRAVIRGIRKERKRCVTECIEVGHHELATYLSLGPQPPLEMGEKHE